jgi:tripeptidyl-peptidase-1
LIQNQGALAYTDNRADLTGSDTDKVGAGDIGLTSTMGESMLLLVLAVASASVIPEGTYDSNWYKNPVPTTELHGVSLTIVVKEQGMAEVKRIALDVNDPASKNYGKFITHDELDRLTSPKASDLFAVKSWLNANDIAYTIEGVSNIKVSTSVLKASELLSTSFHEISNSKYGQSIVRAAAYYLPENIDASITTIFGLHGLPLPPTHPLVIASTDASQPAKVDPNVLAATYKIAGVKTSGSVKNRQAVVEFQGQLSNSTDLATLFKVQCT